MKKSYTFYKYYYYKCKRLYTNNNILILIVLVLFIVVSLFQFFFTNIVNCFLTFVALFCFSVRLLNWSCLTFAYESKLKAYCVIKLIFSRCKRMNRLKMSILMIIKLILHILHFLFYIKRLTY